MTTDNPVLKTYFILVNAEAKPICIDEDMNYVPSIAYHPTTIAYFDSLSEALYANDEYCKCAFNPVSVSFVIGKTEAKIYS